MSELVKFLNLSNKLEFCSVLFPSQHCRQGGISNDLIVWLDGARQSLSTFSKKYEFAKIKNLTNSDPIIKTGNFVVGFMALLFTFIETCDNFCFLKHQKKFWVGSNKDF
jgi:hypothetical protein